jgi:hypothetical protein
MQKKNKDLKQRRRLVLPRETLRQLSDVELTSAAGGTCYSDVNNSQCCPDI